MNIKESDHKRYQEMLNDGCLDELVDMLMEEDENMTPSDFNNAVFVITYLKKLRKGIYESIFESLRNGVPPLIALATVLGVLGVKEVDIDAAFGMKTSAVSKLYIPNGPV